MSDNWICVIPKDPNWTPNSKQTIDVRNALKRLMPQSEEIEFEIDEVVKFRDCGGNLESVKCPKCHAAIAIERWQELMDLDFKRNCFQMSKYKMDCCGLETSLNDLVYNFNQGFSRFIVSCMNPSKGELTVEEINVIENALSTKISVVYQHI